MCDQTVIHALETEVQELRARLASIETQHAYEAQFRRALESIGAVFYLTDLAKNQVKYVSPAYERIWGRTPQSLYDDISSFVAAIDEPHRRLVFDALTRQLRGETTEIEYLVQRPDGSASWVRDRAFPVTGDRGAFQLVTGIAEEITEEKETENRLRATERRYRDLFENAPVMYVLTASTPEGPIITDCNISFCTALGYRREDVLGAPLVRYYTAESAAELLNRGYREALQHGITQVERSLVTAEGEVIPCLLQAVPRLDDEQQLIGTLAAFVDITDRKQAEQALAASEANFRSLIESSEAGIAIIDGNGVYRYLNHVAAALLGSTPDALTGRSMHDLFPPPVAQRQAEVIRQVIDTGEGVVTEAPTVVAAGTRWFHTSVQPLRSAAGVVDRAMINTFDITERKETEQVLERRVEERTEEIRRLSELQRTVVDNAGLAIITSDVDTIVQTFNPEAERMLGYSADEVIGKLSTVCFHLPEEVARFRAQLSSWPAHLEDTKIQPTPIECTYVRKDGSHIPVLLTISALRDATGAVTGLLGIAADITLRKHAEMVVREREETLRQANASLARANRAKDEFLASMSHELRTPLNNIAVLAEILQEQLRGPLNSWQLKSVQSIDKSARHLLALINDVLDIAKIEADKIDLNLEPVAVLAACQSSLAFVRETAQRKGLTVDYPAVPTGLTIVADERRLKQILVNLLSNAVKFTPSGGRVSLNVSADATEETIRFVVEDTGIGIAAQDLKLIFDPFSQVDSSLTRQHEGTGLGLSLVKQLVDMHGGSVTVTSMPGKGSRFTVTLPWKQAVIEVPVHGEQEGSADPVPVTTAHAVILLADDNELNTDTLGEYLEMSGFHVIVARDGAEALAKADAEQPQLILMDIQMPSMDGLEATRRLRADARFATTPIIALTALAMAGDRERCLAAGATEYMSKPLSPRAVVEVIRRLLDGGR